MNTEENLKKQIEKLLNIQTNLDKKVDADDFRKIAEDLGITDSEWQEIQEIAENHFKNANAYLRHENWIDAIEAYKKTLEINPNHLNALLGISLANQELYKIKRVSDYRTQAEKFAQKALEIEAGNNTAIRILSELKKPIKQSQNLSSKKTSRQITLLVVAALFALLGIGLMTFIMVFNGSPNEQETYPEKAMPSSVEATDFYENEIIALREEVIAQWYQVENVYQRRADLIPNLTRLLKAEQNFEQDLIQRILDAQVEINQIQIQFENIETVENFQEKQLELSEDLNELLLEIEDKGLGTKQTYRDFRVQLEGSENRIAVERRKYNEKVRAYNTLIQQSPYNEYGFEKIEYFQMQKGAENPPVVDIE